MERYRDMTIKKKSNLKMIRNLVFFLLLIVLTYMFIFKDQDINELVSTIKSVDLLYVFISILLMFAVYFSESFNI